MTAAQGDGWGVTEAEVALPCPFCGKRPTINKVRSGTCQLHGERLYEHVVSCSGHAVFSHPRSRDDAVAAWNARPAPAGDAEGSTPTEAGRRALATATAEGPAPDPARPGPAGGGHG